MKIWVDHQGWRIAFGIALHHHATMAVYRRTLCLYIWKYKFILGWDKQTRILDLWRTDD